MQIVKNNWTYALGAILGAVAGYLYWRYVGCSTGSCPITSSPTISSIYGAVMGLLIGGTFKKTKKAEEK